MLIYNNKKEFLGIDEKDLNSLGFSNLSELMANFVDFADMFVNKPGFVHNFNHLSWIDFISCADSIQESKAIIDTKSKTFECLLDVKIAYLTDAPSSKSYLINLVNLKEITSSDITNISEEVFTKPVQIIQNEPEIDFQTQKSESQTIEDFEIPEPPFEETNIQETVQEEPEIYSDLDTPLDLDFDDEILKPTPQSIETKKVDTSVEIFDNGYIYDPHIASDELGLPVDLIEEFIEDFIAQANEFKVPLYQSLENAQSDNLKSLSHKLKGVAANLRIEDAFEALLIINTSNDDNEIKTNLDLFYKIISKLSSKTKEILDEDDIVIDFKHLDEPDLDIDIDDMFIDDSQFYNKKNIAKEIGIDYENFLELYNDYTNEAKNILSSISDAIEINDPNTWKNKALQLNAMCENMRMCSFIDGLDILMKTDDIILAKEAIISLENTLIKIFNAQG